ncbi:DMT family transporter [uncultured Gilvimarinus sp.]|uniref:DMT family transporter n=1 Tax=uncultured Gilvimarinus sp. TaxID=1689143 RepID=UPI0030EDCD87|tara:strand:- start:6187 stop:7134 length:948 start_codon:yes stop_codon:yes gene_type:complete
MSIKPEPTSAGVEKSGLKAWLMYALLTIVLWGVWGATIVIPENNGFPAELGYIMWSLSMLVPSLFCLRRVRWKLDISIEALAYGAVIGFLGGVGQLILYSGAIANGPAYLIFPIIALAPVVTICLSFVFLKERVGKVGGLGIVVALIAIPFLNYSDGDGSVQNSVWLFYAILVFLAWGIQGFYLKQANNKISAESIFFYMAITSVMLAPVAWYMTDEPLEANWGLDGAGLAFGIGLFNAFGALFLVYAFRYGKAILVSPMVNCLPPIVTSVLSLLILQTLPTAYAAVGMALAIFSAFLLVVGEESDDVAVGRPTS